MKNEKETKQMIEVMQASLEGAEIECRYKNGGQWARTDCPDWEWYTFQYRVKPTAPNEVWVNISIDGIVGKVRKTKDSANACRNSYEDLTVRYIRADDNE